MAKFYRHFLVLLTRRSARQHTDLCNREFLEATLTKVSVEPGGIALAYDGLLETLNTGVLAMDDKLLFVISQRAHGINLC